MSSTMWGDAFGHQDWGVQSTSTGRRKPASAAAKKQDLQDAARQGQVVRTQKISAGNKSSAARNDRSMQKLEEADDVGQVKRVGGSVSRAIQQARQAKGWTQKELGMRIAEKAAVVGQYESGRAIPNNYIIQKMERALGTRLRGGQAQAKGGVATRGRRRGASASS